tara:strand:+ start:256 stop:477 length:222 start_codon:yes stop_codon:yes gene_type:complete
MIKSNVKKLFNKSKIQKKSLKPLFTSDNQFQSSDINVLLNRVKLNEKLEFRKKIYFISIGLIGISIFAVVFFN